MVEIIRFFFGDLMLSFSLQFLVPVVSAVPLLAKALLTGRMLQLAFLRLILWCCGLQWQTPLASYQIRKIAGCACAGNARNVFPRRRFQRKPIVSDPGMHHGTCVTHVPWCMSGSLTCGDGENVPGIPGACAPAILSIWQEAHGTRTSCSYVAAHCCASPTHERFGLVVDAATVIYDIQQ